MLLSYLGPETALPVVSVLGSLVGLLLLGWRYVVAGLKGALRLCGRLVGIKPKPAVGTTSSIAASSIATHADGADRAAAG